TQTLPTSSQSLTHRLLTVSYFAYFPDLRHLPSLPTRRSSDLARARYTSSRIAAELVPSARADSSVNGTAGTSMCKSMRSSSGPRSEEHTSELQSLAYLVCRLLLEKKKVRILFDRTYISRIREE